MIQVFKIKVMCADGAMRFMLDGRDEGGHWFTYDRAVAVRKLAEMRARSLAERPMEIVSS